jgi:hypothetical protein
VTIIRRDKLYDWNKLCNLWISIWTYLILSTRLIVCLCNCGFSYECHYRRILFSILIPYFKLYFLIYFHNHNVVSSFLTPCVENFFFKGIQNISWKCTQICMGCHMELIVANIKSIND